jgi:hypothetical protein
VADGENKYEQFTIPDLVDDPVVTRAHSPLAASPDQLGCRRWPGLGCQQFDRRLDAPASRRVQLPQLTSGCR